jgi:TonB family protein
MTRGYLMYEVHRPPRWNTFFAGLGINLAAVLVLITYAPQFTTVEQRDPVQNSNHVTLVAPLIEHPRPIPEAPKIAKVESPKPLPLPVEQVRPPQPVKVETPKIERPKPEIPKPEIARVETPAPKIPKFSSAAVAPPAARPAPPTVKTNVFSSEKSEIATVQKPARQVQTGGFGDPNGAAGQGAPKRNTVAVASVGSFDLPSGPGTGNGTGGSRGVSGVVRSAGFGEAVSSNGPSRSNRTVIAGEFHEAVVQGSSTPELQRVDKKPELQPVEVTFKPRPAYTDEARRRRVEGEVLLDVVFEASGSLHINRVVKGLGYGLDDNALAAARRIQFRPARRDGQPYDCAALVHIVFELSE